ncbi:MAG TPA: redoxin domain-containing protein [Verrucomicrobiae bacterium]|nr:redoxin domain-containing protein [Verrucomicrobiae bacterium]
MNHRLLILLGLLLVGTLPLAGADAKTEFTDLQGVVQRPLDTAARTATVLVFVWHTCPVANAYAPEIERIYQDFKQQGVAFYLVQVDPGLKLEKARQHVKDYGYTMPVLHDAKGVLSQHTGATMTPEAVVLLPDGHKIYNGRIDDRHAALGKRRPKATVHDLRDTLEAILAGKKLKPRSTEVIGCYLPEK